MEKREYYEEELTEQFIDRIGMIRLVCYDPHILMLQDSIAYTIDGNMYEIDATLPYWREVLKYEYVGSGYMGRFFELEKIGWRKYFSKSYFSYYLIAPDYVAEMDKIVGEEDDGNAFFRLTELLVNDDYIYYARKNAKSFLL